jgi:threonine-phosphate decarboxylase
VTGSIPAHGGQLQHLALQFAIPAGELLDFSANINPEGPPPAVLAALRSALDEPSVLTAYPDLDEFELKRAIARYAGPSEEKFEDNIVVANGFVPLIESALRTLHIRRCLLPVPAFVEYRKALARAEVEIVPHALAAESNFQHDLEAMLAGPHDAILLANPQNPSGAAASLDFMLQLAEAAAARGIYILLDEAFIDYLSESSLAPLVERFPRLIVFRSVTKFHGIPGLRVAYAVAHRDLARSLNESLPPWPITILASRAVTAALADESYAIRTRLLNRERRQWLFSQLQALGIHAYPSAANFLFFRLPSTIDPAAFWQRMIVAHRIVLRHCGNYEALSPGHFRAAVRTEAENQRLVYAISESLRAVAHP